MARKQPPVQTELFVLQGGLDLVTSPLQLAPGKLIDALNFEPDINGGYRRMYGYERYDGRPSPSAAAYWNQAVVITGAIAVGNTVTGATSGATAVVLKVNGTTELIVTKVVGTFVVETLNVGGLGQATVSTTLKNSAKTPLLDAQYQFQAANNYRNDIAKPAGSGPVRGIHMYNGVQYCFRDNAGATAGVMFKSTATGWSAVALGRELLFTTATGQINDGDTVVGATSAATGVVKRALLRTGTWGAAGVGSLVFATITGTFQNGENVQVGGVTKVVANGADTAITITAGGRYEMRNYNFSGTLANYRMYGCDGVNLAFEFDGTTYVPIHTAIATDAPTHIELWKNMLVLSFKSSVDVSGIGLPYSWTALTGAAELALGDTCTGLLAQLGDASFGALAIFTARKTFILYGNSSADFKLVTQSPDAGAQPFTAQNIGYAYYLDTKGIVQINSTRNYGNFEMSTLSRLVQPLIDAKRGLAVASCIVRATNQYRLFYSDGTGLIVFLQPGAINPLTGTMGGNTVGGIMFFDYGAAAGLYLNSVMSDIDAAGVEHVFAAGSDGFVYELEKGTSMDGGNMKAHILTAFNSNRSPRYIKHYSRCIVQATCKGTAAINVGYDLNYGSSECDRSSPLGANLVGGGSWWDIFKWDSFNWDQPWATDYTIDTPGNGNNISIIVFEDANYDLPYTIESVIVHYSIRRLKR